MGRLGRQKDLLRARAFRNEGSIPSRVFWLSFKTLTLYVSMVFVILRLKVQLLGGVQKSANIWGLPLHFRLLTIRLLRNSVAALGVGSSGAPEQRV